MGLGCSDHRYPRLERPDSVFSGLRASPLVPAVLLNHFGMAIIGSGVSGLGCCQVIQVAHDAHVALCGVGRCNADFFDDKELPRA